MATATVASTSQPVLDQLSNLPPAQQKAVVQAAAAVNGDLLPKSDTGKIIIWICVFLVLGFIAIFSLISLINGSVPDGLTTGLFGLISGIVGGILGWMTKDKAP